MNDTAFRAGTVAVAVTAAALVARVSFHHPVELPELPRRPAPPSTGVEVTQAAAAATTAIESDPAIYAERLASDSRELRVEPAATPAALSVAMPHRADRKRRELDPKRRRASAEVLGLALSLAVTDIEGTPHRQMVLTIENRTRDHLAYRVVTRVSRGLQACYGKRDIAHNAIALAPGEKTRRSECLYRNGLKLFVDRVETIRLPELSYYYVSALPASAIGLERLDRLSARGHRPAGGRSPCRVFHAADLSSAMSSGAASWRDLVDFYARHPCGVYSFTSDYKAFEKDRERPLPAISASP